MEMSAPRYSRHLVEGQRRARLGATPPTHDCQGDAVPQQVDGPHESVNDRDDEEYRADEESRRAPRLVPVHDGVDVGLAVGVEPPARPVDDPEDEVGEEDETRLVKVEESTRPSPHPHVDDGRDQDEPVDHEIHSVQSVGCNVSRPGIIQNALL